MEVEEEDGTQQVRKAADYGIEVDFESLDDDERQVSITRPWRVSKFTLSQSQDNSADAAAEFNALISKLNAEIERMAP